MEKVKLALNYALMIEMIKANGYRENDIIQVLEEGNESLLNGFGDGIPTWQTLLDYYNNNKEKCKKAILDGYEITFLTKGALKSLLRIKFNMKENVDFIDTGEFLNKVKITKENLRTLREIISMNWNIVEEASAGDEDYTFINIELTYKPIFKFMA